MEAGLLLKSSQNPGLAPDSGGDDDLATLNRFLKAKILHTYESGN
jgi:hypothetical protein